MSVETRGREAAEGLRAATTVDVEWGLSQLRRTRRRRDAGRVVMASVVLAAAVGGLLMVRDIGHRAEPVHEIPVGNGRIIHPAQPPANGWQKTPPSGKAPYHEWNAFDQDTEKFLYYSWPLHTDDAPDAERLGVVSSDGLVADILCPQSVRCGWSETFGPDADEITVLKDASLPTSSLQVIAYDGTLRETLDISAAVGPDKRLSDMAGSLAWSPDGTRLAVANDAGEVWIVERDGSEPQLVHTEHAPDELVEGKYPNKPVLGELTWSPDGRSLALVVAPFFLQTGPDNGVWPRLVALRLPPGQPVRAETLHVYDDCADSCYAWNLLANNYAGRFAFAWSPDGTRIAVTSDGGVAEISAEDGDILARHPGEDVHGPLAWLRER